MDESKVLGTNAYPRLFGPVAPISNTDSKTMVQQKIWLSELLKTHGYLIAGQRVVPDAPATADVAQSTRPGSNKRTFMYAAVGGLVLYFLFARQ
mgnify:CR=1 FL=1